MATITLADFEENDAGADELNQMFNDVDMMFNDDDSESGNEDEHDAMPEHHVEEDGSEDEGSDDDVVEIPPPAPTNVPDVVIVSPSHAVSGKHALPMAHTRCLPAVPVVRDGTRTYVPVCLPSPLVPSAHDGKRVSYTLGQKVSYLRRMQALGYGVRHASKTFQIPRGTLQGWKRTQLEMENQYFSMTRRGYADKEKNRPLVKWSQVGAAAYASESEPR